MANINENALSSASQCNRILAWLKDGYSITQMQALARFQCGRLASRINDLRNKGYLIKTNIITTNTGKRVAEYTLNK